MASCHGGEVGLGIIGEKQNATPLMLGAHILTCDAHRQAGKEAYRPQLTIDKSAPQGHDWTLSQSLSVSPAPEVGKRCESFLTPTQLGASSQLSALFFSHCLPKYRA